MTLKTKDFLVVQFTFTLHQDGKKNPKNKNPPPPPPTRNNEQTFPDLKTFEFQCLWKSLLADRWVLSSSKKPELKKLFQNIYLVLKLSWI